MKRKIVFGIGALGLAGAGVAGVLAFDSARASGSYERPFISIEVDPDIGSVLPTVRLERIRRSSEKPASGPELAVDSGMINFEILAENLSDGPVEVERIITRFNGINMPSGWFEGMDIADLMHNANGSFSKDGNVMAKSDSTDYMIALTGIGLHDDANDYAVGGYALVDGVMKFYVARHDDSDGAVEDESFLFEGQVIDMAGLAGVAPEPVFAAGQKGFDYQTQLGVIAKYDSADDSLVLDNSFGVNGVVELDIPNQSGEQLNQIETVEVGGQRYIVTAGTVTYNNELRPFLARFNEDGTPDQSFGAQGVKLFPGPTTSRIPRAIGFRKENGAVVPSIYLLEGVGTGSTCRNSLPGCVTELTRLDWADGKVDNSFGNQGTATIKFPDSISDLPFGLVLHDTGRIIVGATRMQKVTKAPWVGLAGLTPEGKIDPAFAGLGFRLQSFNLESVLGRGLVLNNEELSVGAVVCTPNARRVALFRYDVNGTLITMTENRQHPVEDPQINGYFVDGKDRFVAVGFETVQTQLTRFRRDGRLDWRGVIDYSEIQRIRWPDDREVNFPTSIEFDLYVEEWILPYTKTMQVEDDELQMALPLEKAGELEWWRVNQHHRLRDKHRGALNQRYAYDLVMYRWSKVNKKWTSTRKDYDKDNDPLLTAYLAYGREVHAGKAGKVVGCWNTAPENQNPPAKDAYVPGEMPTGGNVIDILHNDGSIAHYSHLQPGSIPEYFCPNTCANYTSDTQDPWTPADEGDEDATCNEAIAPAQNAWVQAGDTIGLLGNSGNTTGPHLHFHVIDEKQGRPVYFKWTTTERQVHPDEQNGAVSLQGASAPAPMTNDVYSLMRHE